MCACVQLIEGLEAHMTLLRGTMKRKKKKKPVEDRAKPRAASMAIDVREEKLTIDHVTVVAYTDLFPRFMLVLWE